LIFPRKVEEKLKKKRSRTALVILEKKVVGLSEEALERFLLRARKAVGLAGRVNVLVTSSTNLRSLNQRFRSENKATDVLSFPATRSMLESRKRTGLAGEVAISADIALKNSFRLGHPAVQEIKILALHGILHLAGFDHEGDNGEMARREVKLRLALGLPAALIERAGAGDVPRSHKKSLTQFSKQSLKQSSKPGHSMTKRASAQRMA
jgi:probable rRNA maturation factor